MNPGSKSKSSTIWSWTIPIGLAVFVLGTCLFGYSLRQIFVDVDEACTGAKQRYPGDHVEALIALIEADDVPFKEKNRAIWALGQIGDRRALPLLRKLDTDEVQKKPYDPGRYICQYSVDKAIRHIEGDISLTRWMYRFL